MPCMGLVSFVKSDLFNTPLPSLRCPPAASSVIVPGISGCCQWTPHFLALVLFIRADITSQTHLLLNVLTVFQRLLELF